MVSQSRAATSSVIARPTGIVRSAQGVDRVTRKLVTVSASTGELPRALSHLPVHRGHQQVLRASPPAQLLIAGGTQPGPAAGSVNPGHSAGTLSRGRLTPAPAVQPHLRGRPAATTPAATKP
jgi:hypothetical protein